MTTFTTLQEDALTILSFFEQYRLSTDDAIHYSRLCGDARNAGMDLPEFRAALEWLTDNRCLDISKSPVDSYTITSQGRVMAARLAK